MKQAIIYARVATLPEGATVNMRVAKQAQAYHPVGLTEQLTACRAYAAQRGFSVVAEFQGVF